MSKALELQGFSNKFNLDGSGVSQRQETVSGDNHSQNIRDKLWFLCEIEHCEKRSNSVL